jgi:hypothetical protein
MDTKNLPIAICYPPGAGGSFLGAALNSAIFNSNFIIEPDGKCHANPTLTVPHYVPAHSIQGMQDEFDALMTIKFPQNKNFILVGHVRNLVALQSICTNLWFIKISFDTSNDNEIEFLYQMLIAKVPAIKGLSTCYHQVKEDNWPDTIEEFLQDPKSSIKYKEQNYHTYKNWFWVENQATKSRTIELSFRDIFFGVPGETLSQWFDKQTIDTLFKLNKEYQTVNRELYSSTFKLLE